MNHLPTINFQMRFAGFREGYIIYEGFSYSPNETVQKTRTLKTQSNAPLRIYMNWHRGIVASNNSDLVFTHLKSHLILNSQTIETNQGIQPFFGWVHNKKNSQILSYWILQAHCWTNRASWGWFLGAHCLHYPNSFNSMRECDIWWSFCWEFFC